MKLEKEKYKIVVVGLGYVGLSNAVLLAQHNQVIGVDTSQQRVDLINEKKSPVVDEHLSAYLANNDLDLVASTDLPTAIIDADYVIVATPTDYDEDEDRFDTATVEAVIRQVIEIEPKAYIVVKSTVPIGFSNNINSRFQTNKVAFSPEFLREGKALLDNLNPSRIIIGDRSKRAEIFAALLVRGAIKKDIKCLYTDPTEAEAIKLFANTYLAMRVAFFNELDSFAMTKNLKTRDIIDGVSLDPRIGNHYNNPSFGYGGYCLPKDTKQLLVDYSKTPQQLMTAIVSANSTRKRFISEQIQRLNPKTVGVYRLAMKIGSDNFRESSIKDIIRQLLKTEINVIIYEPSLNTKKFQKCSVYSDLKKFKAASDVIIANRINDDLSDVAEKLFSRDLFNCD